MDKMPLPLSRGSENLWEAAGCSDRRFSYALRGLEQSSRAQVIIRSGRDCFAGLKHRCGFAGEKIPERSLRRAPSAVDVDAVQDFAADAFA
jgi:hypothetical protein